MNASTALVRLPQGRVAPAGVVALRRRMLERALDEAAAGASPRAWMEALEPRRMLSAVPAFESHGLVKALWPARYRWATPSDAAVTADGKLVIVGEMATGTAADAYAGEPTS